MFEKEETIKKIPAYKYVVPPEVFQCPDKNPDNFCYCPDPDDELCHHDGGLLIEACMAGNFPQSILNQLFLLTILGAYF